MIKLYRTARAEAAHEPAGCHDEIVGQLSELAAKGVQRLVALVQLQCRAVPEKLAQEELLAPPPAAVNSPDLGPLVARRELSHTGQQINHLIRPVGLDNDPNARGDLLMFLVHRTTLTRLPSR
jgi:hypothetical protein